MDRYHSSRARCDLGSHRIGIEVESIRLNIGEHRCRAQKAYCVGCSYKCERRYNDFVAGPNPTRSQCKYEGICSGCDADSESTPTVICNLLFKTANLRSEYKSLRLQYGVESLTHFFANRGVLSF